MSTVSSVARERTTASSPKVAANETCVGVATCLTPPSHCELRVAAGTTGAGGGLQANRQHGVRRREVHHVHAGTALK